MCKNIENMIENKYFSVILFHLYMFLQLLNCVQKEFKLWWKWLYECLILYHVLYCSFQSSWKKLEDVCNIQIPRCVKSLLIDAGYNTILSLNEFNEAKIKTIEDFLNANKQHISKLKCCYSQHYKELEVFAFLPGHKSVILSLANQAKQYQERISNSTYSTQHKRSANHHSLMTDAQLKTKLLQNLRRYSKTISPDTPSEAYSEANIQEFERISSGNSVCKCVFTCPFCVKKFSLIYKTFWMSSNATKHLKTHLQK